MDLVNLVFNSEESFKHCTLTTYYRLKIKLRYVFLASYITCISCEEMITFYKNGGSFCTYFIDWIISTGFTTIFIVKLTMLYTLKVTESSCTCMSPAEALG